MARAPRLSLNRVVVGKYDLVRSVSMDGCVSERPRYSVSRAYDCSGLRDSDPYASGREEALAAHERHHRFALALTHGVRDDLERRPGLDERDLHELRAEVDADHVTRGQRRGRRGVAERYDGALHRATSRVDGALQRRRAQACSCACWGVALELAALRIVAASARVRTSSASYALLAMRRCTKSCSCRAKSRSAQSSSHRHRLSIAPSLDPPLTRKTSGACG